MSAEEVRDIFSIIYKPFGWVIIALSIIFIILLLPLVRRKVKEINLYGDHCEKYIADFYENHLHFFVIARLILLFLIPVGVFVIFFDFSMVREHLLSLIVLGLSLTIFVSIELPSLMKAHILVTFKIRVGEDYKEYKPNEQIIFESVKTTYVESGVWNLGFSTYKNFTVIFYFGKDFKIHPYDEPQYKDLDFKKKFDIQKRHGGVIFTPKDNFLTIPPQEVFVFAMYIEVPNEEKEAKMSIQFFSENTWGLSRIWRQISIK